MVNTMENAEEVMQILDRFTRLKQKEIPKELDDYLQYVAKTGDTVFKWSSLKYLFREKLLNVIKHFHDTTPRVDEIPQYPNVDPFNYESMKSSLLERLEHFNAAPFTIQRLCELLIDPRKQYSRIDKFMRALEKNILVVSTVEPGRKRTDSENGDSLDSVVNGDLSLDVNVDIEMDNEALFAIEGQNGNGAIPVPVPVAVAAVVEALNDCKEKSGVAILNAENSNASRSGDDDILPHPKKAKLELHDNEKKLEEAVEEEEKGVQKEKQELKNGNDEVKPALEVATCAEKTEKVEEKEKKVEENGNMEIEKTNEALEKQEDAKTVVKKDEKVVEEQKMLVEETAKETAKPTSVSTVEVKEVKEIIEKHKNESELKNQKEVEKAEIQTNDVNEKPLIEQKKEIVEKKVVVEEDVKEPQEVLKHTEEQLKVATVEKEEIKVDAIEPTIAAAAAVTDTKTDTVTDKIVENIENIPEKVETATATAQEETIHKKDANENKDTTKTEKVVEVEPTVVAKISSETKVEPAVVEKPTVEQVTEKVAAETKAVVEEKVVEKVENLETAAKADETEKKQELTASTEKTETTVEDVQKTTDTVVGVVATDATVAEEQKTEQIVSDDIKVEKSENVSPAAVPVPVVAKPAVVAEKPKIVTEVEVEENMQMPIETDSPTAAAGIDIDEIPSAMVSSELPAVVPTIPILNEASPAVSILAPALSLNDQPMEDLPMEESAPEEVVMAETVAAGNGALVDQMTTDAMEASGKDELPVDGMDVDDTSQEAMDQ